MKRVKRWLDSLRECHLLRNFLLCRDTTPVSQSVRWDDKRVLQRKGKGRQRHWMVLFVHLLLLISSGGLKTSLKHDSIFPHLLFTASGQVRRRFTCSQSFFFVAELLLHDEAVYPIHIHFWMTLESHYGFIQRGTWRECPEAKGRPARTIWWNGSPASFSFSIKKIMTKIPVTCDSALLIKKGDSTPPQLRLCNLFVLLSGWYILSIYNNNNGKIMTGREGVTHFLVTRVSK